MKMKNIAFTVILLFLVQNCARAERQLDKAEILQVFETLTRQPRRTWIPGGTIEATHHEYKSSSGYMTDSTVTVKYDGERFYWEINVDSYTKQNNNSNPPQNNFDLNWNKKRVFTWDGERYTMYFRPANHAIVRENPTNIPVVVNGPLTAGIVPWGHGIYTLEELSAAQSSANVGAQGHVHLILNKTDLPEIVFVLDPTKDYALLSCLMNFAGGASIKKTYGDYESVLGKWIPTTIIIERYGPGKQSPELLSCDHWELTSITPIPPQSDSFHASYETDARVEFYSPIGNKAFSYRYYSEVDTESLLQEKLAIALTEQTQSQNCATVAIKYISERLGKNITDQDLAELVSEPNKSTNLYALRQFARELDLHCLAVKTDIQALKNLKNCQAILHLPGINHYVVFEYIDDEYVWVIDLDSNKFFYRTKLKEFGLVWSAGTALLVSDKPLEPDPNDTPINDSDLQKIIGSIEGGLTDFSCSDTIQEYKYLYCPPPIGGYCAGRVWEWPERWGCEPNSVGPPPPCNGTDWPGTYSYPCINKVGNPGECDVEYTLFIDPIRACY
ncbi:MAG: cysteine peptidase family C39 domain-containing protein [Planctomycetota bacterium]|jgi:predicted double-glycine peptidase